MEMEMGKEVRDYFLIEKGGRPGFDTSKKRRGGKKEDVF